MRVPLESRVDSNIATVADRVPDTVVEQRRVVFEVIESKMESLAGATLNQIHEFWKHRLQCLCCPDWHLLHCLNLTKITSLGNGADRG